MISNRAIMSQKLRNTESPPSRKKGIDTKQQLSTDLTSPVVANDLQHRPSSKTNNILTVNNTHNSPSQLRPELEIPSTGKEARPLYVNDRDDEDTVSVLSDGDAFIVDTQFGYDENQNSGPSCTFAGTNLQQQQHYMGGNYFFRQNTNAAENDCHDAVSYNPIDHCETKESSADLPLLQPPSTSNSTGEANSDDLRNLVEALKKEKADLSKKCTKLESLVLNTCRDHNCYKAKTTMAIGNLRIQMESEREDKKYLLDKCHNLEKELQQLRTSYDSKLGTISALQEKIRLSSNSKANTIKREDAAVPKDAMEDPCVVCREDQASQ